jgi:hypothetical protein
MGNKVKFTQIGEAGRSCGVEKKVRKVTYKIVRKAEHTILPSHRLHIQKLNCTRQFKEISSARTYGRLKNHDE